MACDSGQGSFIGFTVDTDRYGATDGPSIAVPQALTRLATEAITDTSLVKVREISNWPLTVEVFDAPNLDDGMGAYRQKRYGCDVDHGPWTATIEFNGEYDVTLLINTHGTLRRTFPNGAYFEGKAKCVAAMAYPNHSASDEAMGELTFQFDGGTGADAPSFTAAV